MPNFGAAFSAIVSAGRKGARYVTVTYRSTTRFTRASCRLVANVIDGNRLASQFHCALAPGQKRLAKRKATTEVPNDSSFRALTAQLSHIFLEHLNSIGTAGPPQYCDVDLKP